MNPTTKIFKPERKNRNVFFIICCLMLQFSIYSQEIVSSALNPFFSISQDGTVHGSAGELKVDQTDSCNEGILQWFKITTTGVFSAEIEEAIDLFPNPFIDQFTVNVNEEKYQLSIYASDGKQLKSINLNKGPNMISMMTFPAGSYFLKIEDTNQLYFSQLIQKL